MISFNRVFEFEPTLPFDNMLTVQVFDWDMMSGDDLIGETEIDIENRFYSKHRASCGLQKDYITLVLSTHLCHDCLSEIL